MLHSTIRWHPPSGVEIDARGGVRIKETTMKGTVEKNVNILAACYVTGTWLGCVYVCSYLCVYYIYQSDSLRPLPDWYNG